MYNDFDSASFTCPFCGSKNWIMNNKHLCKSCGRRDPDEPDYGNWGIGRY